MMADPCGYARHLHPFMFPSSIHSLPPPHLSSPSHHLHPHHLNPVHLSSSSSPSSASSPNPNQSPSSSSQQSSSHLSSDPAMMSFLRDPRAALLGIPPPHLMPPNGLHSHLPGHHHHLPPGSSMMAAAAMASRSGPPIMWRPGAPPGGNNCMNPSDMYNFLAASAAAYPSWYLAAALALRNGNQPSAGSPYPGMAASWSGVPGQSPVGSNCATTVPPPTSSSTSSPTASGTSTGSNGRLSPGGLVTALPSTGSASEFLQQQLQQHINNSSHQVSSSPSTTIPSPLVNHSTPPSLPLPRPLILSAPDTHPSSPTPPLRHSGSAPLIPSISTRSPDSRYTPFPIFKKEPVRTESPTLIVNSSSSPSSSSSLAN